jgi:hypothetical protein
MTLSQFFLPLFLSLSFSLVSPTGLSLFGLLFSLIYAAIPPPQTTDCCTASTSTDHNLVDPGFSLSLDLFHESFFGFLVGLCLFVSQGFVFIGLM